jgi:hypothetical protein
MEGAVVAEETKTQKGQPKTCASSYYTKFPVVDKDKNCV